MECKVCGQDNPPEARFCGNCGATLVAAVEAPPPAAAPEVAVEYVDGVTRLGAALIDGVIVGIISSVLFPFAWVGTFLSAILLLCVYHWLFTGLKGQTPGKMVFRIKVVDAQGNQPTLKVAALREVLGKLISTVVLCVGFLWIAFDDSKQGWHDKIANTYVIKVESTR